MRNVFRGLAVITMGLAVYAGTADAQMASPVRFGIGAGLTIPTGDAGDVLDNGFNVQGLVGFAPAEWPLGFRGEVVYHSLDYGSDVGFDGKTTVLGGGVNALFSLPMGENVVRPYLTGGVGVYRAEFDVDPELGGGSVKETKFGANGGGGLMFDLAGFGAFIEARYLSIFTDESNTNLIPITFGIMLGGR